MTSVAAVWTTLGNGILHGLVWSSTSTPRMALCGTLLLSWARAALPPMWLTLRNTTTSLKAAAFTRPSHQPAHRRTLQPQMVPRGDYARCLAEFWADDLIRRHPGPLVHHLERNHGLPGFGLVTRTGPVARQAEYTVKAYLALAGAMHDSAVATWSVKATMTTPARLAPSATWPRWAKAADTTCELPPLGCPSSRATSKW